MCFLRGKKAPAATAEGRKKLGSGTRTGFWIPETGFWIPGQVSGHQERVSGYQERVFDTGTGPQTPKNTQVGHQVGGQNRDTQFLIAVFLIASWGGVPGDDDDDGPSLEPTCAGTKSPARVPHTPAVFSERIVFNSSHLGWLNGHTAVSLIKKTMN